MTSKMANLVTTGGGDGYNDYDISMEDLSFLISPRNMPYEPTPSTGTMSSSSESTFSPTNPKVSPQLASVDTSLGPSQPAVSSVRGYDSENKPIFSSSQTPNGFNAQTKRKPTKKSVFSFEGFDILPGESDRTAGDSGTEEIPAIGETTTPGVSSPEDEAPGHRRRLRIKSFNKERAVSALTAADDEEEDSPEGHASSLSDLPPPRGVFTNESLNDTQFKKSIASNIQTNSAVTLGKWEELSPMARDSNPRKKTSFTGNISPTMDSPYQQTFEQTGPYYPNSASYATGNLSATSQLYMGQQYPANYSQEAYYPEMSMPLPSLTVLHAATLAQYPAMGLGLNSEEMPYPPLPFDDEAAPTPSMMSYPQSMPDRGQNAKYPANSLSHYSGYDLPPSYPTSLRIPSAPYGRVYVQSPESPIEEDGKDKDKNNRTGKSLADISKRFVSMYGSDTAMQYIAGQAPPDDVSDAIATLHRVDSAAEVLQVHVRRIYELIKILEILSFITFAGDKRGKFSWRGTRHFLPTLGAIQEDGIAKYSAIATQNGLTNITADGEAESTTRVEDSSNQPPSLHCPSRETDHSGPEEHFMVEIICKNFLQLFLVGMNSMSMGTVIQKLIPMDETRSLSEYNKINATKIRRVYDVTNVLCSLNLLRKKSIPRKKAQEAEVWNNTASPSTPMSPDSDGKIKSPNKNHRGTERADTKVLEWTSFPPSLIRQRYLASKQPNSPTS